jgi:CubicO group peptidase (beta-lactamase class C family)
MAGIPIRLELGDAESDVSLGSARFAGKLLVDERFAFMPSWRLLFLFWIGSAVALAEPLPQVAPADADIDPTKLAAIDAAIANALDEKKMPGCVVCIGRRGKIALLNAYGQRSLELTMEAMTIDTVFDLASLTKPIATATSAMILLEQGKLKLTEPVASYLPEFAVNGKEAVTIEQLCIHTSGLIPDNAIADYAGGPEKAIERVFALSLKTPAGERFAYSDMNFVVLAELIKKVSGQNVHEFSQQHIFQPLGMKETTYLPGEELRKRTAPTEKRDDVWMRGEVHDPRAYKLGGIAGHAGLFSTAEDLAIYASAMLGRGEYGGVRIMKEETWQEMTRPRKVPGRNNDGKAYDGLRGLGWDVRTGYSSNRGEGMSDSAFGHGGFTGTGIWIDPANDLFVIFLSNRVHPNGKGNVNPLIGRIGTIAVEALK